MAKSKRPVAQYQMMPIMTPDEFAELKQDIKEHGVQIPIVVDTCGDTIDGWHRKRAVDELRAEGVDVEEPARVVLTGLDEEEKQDRAVGLNLRRRNLTTKQKHEFIDRYVANAPESSDREIGRAVGVDGKTVAARRRGAEIPQAGVGQDGQRRAKASVIVLATDDLEKSLEAASKLPDQVSGVLTAAQTRQSVARASAKARNEELRKQGTPELPQGRYKTVAIDPPWPVKRIDLESRPDEAAELDYPTMTLEQIQELDVPSLLDPEGCHVYLWTTQKLLPHALNILKGWGVRYECTLTWDKGGGMTPFSWQYRTELLLFGRFGKGMRLNRLGRPIIFHESARGHSIKPDAFFGLVEEVSPGPRLEMFARASRAGWAAWGNQAPKMDSEPIVVLQTAPWSSPLRHAAYAAAMEAQLEEFWIGATCPDVTQRSTADWDGYIEAVEELLGIADGSGSRAQSAQEILATQGVRLDLIQENPVTALLFPEIAEDLPLRRLKE